MQRTFIRLLASVVAILSGLTTAALIVIAFRANELRWHQGPTIIVITPTHGLHEMDVLLLGLVLASALIALISAVIARR
jgi:S-adenosylmethionine:tRNA-ribosyltransferase-isomerase (queuine synthetase)